VKKYEETDDQLADGRKWNADYGSIFEGCMTGFIEGSSEGTEVK
jgi:hypothetical protein